MDILVTLIIVVVWVVAEIVKATSKQAVESYKKAQQKRRVQPPKQTRYNESVGNEFMHKNEFFEEKSSKSQPYFTYESDLERGDRVGDSRLSGVENLSQNQIQEVENEIETLDIDLQDPEELRKAIIYGEILKNPYN